MNKFLVSIAIVLSMLVCEPAFATPHDGGDNNLGGGNSITSIYMDDLTPNYPNVFAGSASSAWDMLVDATGQEYVQVGWYDAVQQGRVVDGIRYFSEVNYGNGNDHVTWSTVGPQANSIHGYRISVSNGYFVNYADDATIASWPASFTATGYQFYEELNGTTPYNAQFAGQSSAHARFSNIRIFNNGSTYYSPYLTFHNDTDGSYNSFYYTIGNSASTIDLWDSRY